MRQTQKRTAAEVNELIQLKQQQMEHSSLTVKEERAALAEMKQMKNDAQRYLDWETELDVLKHKRAVTTENLRVAYEQLDEQRSLAFRTEAASTLSMAADALVETRLSINEAMQELLGTVQWRKKLTTECGVVTRMDRGPKRGVLLCGAEGAVASAKALIEGIGPVRVLKKVLDEEQQGLLIGKRGATIAQLQEETGCSLEIKKPTGTLTVAGPTAAVNTTEELIDELLRDQRRMEATLKFDPEQKGTLLGKNGSTINRIQQESNGAQLEISRGEECTIRIWGPSAAVARARQSLVSLLYLDAKSVQVVEVPSDLIDLVIGRGERVKKLEEEYAVRIDSSRSADKSEPSKLKFRGSVEGVKAAVAQVSSLIEKEKKIEKTLQVESQHIGLLLGAKGSTIGRIQQESGAVLDVQKVSKEKDNGEGSKSSSIPKDGSQAVTVRGNALQVKKAMAALEAVLQYNAECTEEVTVTTQMMPLLIGRGGEEINRIRLETGAAIDGERYDPKAAKSDEKPTLKLRGTKEAVAKAKEMIEKSIEAHKNVTESVVLPWHAIDVLIGQNGEKLKALESTYAVNILLPGQGIESDQVGLTSFISMPSSLTLKGRKKMVDQCAEEIERISLSYHIEEMQLSDGDGDLLSTLMMADEALLDNLSSRLDVQLEFDPRKGVITLRGDGTVEAKHEIKQLLTNERPTDESVECPPAQFLFLTEDPLALPQLQQLCAPAIVSLQELPPAVSLMAAGRVLPDVTKLCTQWVNDHALGEASQPVPPEVVSIVRSSLKAKAAEWRVQLELKEKAADGLPGSMTLKLSGPSKLVLAGQEAAALLVRQHAHVEERIVLSAGEYALVGLLLERRERSKMNGTVANGKKESKEGAPTAAAGLFDGVDNPHLLPAAGGGAAGAAALPGGGQIVLRGTADPVGKVKSALEALLIDAERSSKTIPMTSPQCDRLTARPPRGGDSLLRKLQDAHVCAIVPDRAGGKLTICGSSEAVERIATILESELDVDEHVREVAERLIPIIIGRGGANIKKLNAESGATLDLDRGLRRITVRGKKAQVEKAVGLLDEIAGTNGESELPVPAKDMGKLIGRGGSKIKELQSESGATIDIRKEENLVRVRGTQQQVEKAMGLIKETLAGGGGNKEAKEAKEGGAAPPGLSSKASPPPPGLAKESPPGLNGSD